jgi:hypothetical protein
MDTRLSYNESVAIMSERTMGDYLKRTDQWLCLCCQRPFKREGNERICQGCREDEE